MVQAYKNSIIKTESNRKNNIRIISQNNIPPILFEMNEQKVISNSTMYIVEN